MTPDSALTRAPAPTWRGLRAGPLVAVGGAAIGVLAVGWLIAVAAMGDRIPQPRIEADYLEGLVWALVIAGSIAFWPVRAEDRRALLLLWLAKCVVTLVLMLPYERHYGLDAYYYFSESRLPTLPTAADDPTLIGGTAAMIRLAWWHNHILPASYHALKVSFSLVGLVAVYVFYRAAERIRPVDRRFLYLLGLFPSILFWSSILGKDPIVLLGIAIYAYGAAGRLGPRPRRGDWLAIVSGVAVAAWVRLWLAPILLAPFLVTAVMNARGGARRLAMAIGCGLLAAVAWRYGSEQLRVSSVEELYALAGQVQSVGWEGGSHEALNLQFNGTGDVLRFLPRGIFGALFRPLPGDAPNAFGLLAGLEDVVLLGLFLGALWRTRWIRFREPIVQWLVLLTLTWAAFYGFISSVNYGAGARFKLQILPVLLALCLHLRYGRAAGTPVPSREAT